MGERGEGGGVVFEVGLESRDDRAPPGFLFRYGGGVVELLFDVEDREEGVFEIGASEGRAKKPGRFGPVNVVGLPGVVAVGGADDGGEDFFLLASAEGEGLGEVTEARVGWVPVAGSSRTGRKKGWSLGGGCGLAVAVGALKSGAGFGVLRSAFVNAHSHCESSNEGGESQGWVEKAHGGMISALAREALVEFFFEKFTVRFEKGLLTRIELWGDLVMKIQERAVIAKQSGPPAVKDFRPEGA